LSVTKTLTGISTRQLLGIPIFILVGLSGNQLLGISYRLLDPRRPIVATADDKEEGILPYYPHLQINPKDVMSNHVLVNG
jgi:hypothetical protein